LGDHDEAPSRGGYTLKGAVRFNHFLVPTDRNERKLRIEVIDVLTVQFSADENKDFPMLLLPFQNGEHPPPIGDQRSVLVIVARSARLLPEQGLGAVEFFFEPRCETVERESGVFGLAFRRPPRPTHDVDASDERNTSSASDLRELVESLPKPTALLVGEEAPRQDDDSVFGNMLLQQLPQQLKPVRVIRGIAKPVVGQIDLQNAHGTSLSSSLRTRREE